MRKTFTSLLVLFMCFSLVGCHGSKSLDEFVIPDEFDTSRNYEISFWNKNDTNATQVAVYNKAIEDFEKLYPNIKVNMKSYTDYNLIYNDVITNISTHTTPNVCISYPDHIATYLTGKNVVICLDELMNNKKYGLGGSDVLFNTVSKDEIVPQFLDECLISGNYYALPFMRSTEAVYINEDLVNKLGYKLPDTLTWDFIFEVSSKALKKDNDGLYSINSQNVMLPFIYKSTDNMMIQMIKQKDSGYADENGNIEIFNETTKDLLKMIIPYAGEKSFSTFKISSYPGNYINAGQCIFGVDSTAGATWMGSKAPNLDIHESSVVDFKMEVKPVPQFNDNKKIISQGPSLCLFNDEDPQVVLASWLFMQYLLTYDVQWSYSNTEGYVPVTNEVINSEKFKDYLSLSGKDEEHYDVKIKAKKILLDNLDSTFVTPVFNGSTSLRTAAGQLIEEVTKSCLRKETIDDAYFDSLFDKMNSLYRLDQNNKLNLEISEEELPLGSKVLLSTLTVTWVILGILYFKERIKKQNRL